MEDYGSRTLTSKVVSLKPPRIRKSYDDKSYRHKSDEKKKPGVTVNGGKNKCIYSKIFLPLKLFPIYTTLRHTQNVFHPRVY